jgi:hypothetical protein
MGQRLVVAENSFAMFGVICADEETELSSESRIKRVAEQKVELQS